MAKGSEKWTERDRYWLRQHAACEASGLSAKVYATQHGLSVDALYQARTRLRSRGVLEASAADGSKAKPVRGFARVAVQAGSRPRYRVRLPNGALIEWEGAAGPELAQVLGAVSQLE